MPYLNVSMPRRACSGGLAPTRSWPTCGCPHQHSYTLTLSLVLLLSLLSAVWGAFYAAARLVAPIRDLAEARDAVADGDYSQQCR